jgi:imidazole glycerol-phosphate synthase subunit HisH
VTAPRIAVIDYGMGNRRSVEKALQHVGAASTITCDHREIRAADGIVVPGVGAFPTGMRNLSELGLDALIVERAAAGVPLLGICLGMQLMFERSAERGTTNGLGLIAGYVAPIAAGGLRLPHIGWNEVAFERPWPLTQGLPPGGCPFYHVHSFAVHPAEAADQVGSTEYGERFATIAGRGNVSGVQFHPEKSSVHGLRMLANFTELCERSASRARAAAGACG